MKYPIAAAAIITTFAGCASTPPSEQNRSGAAPAASASTQAATPRAATAPAASAKGSGNAAVTSAPSQRSVYFEYDSNVVKDEFVPVVKSNAQYVGQQRVTRVKIEGNTDERGSREYNLALGQRRADAVKQRMTLLGVPAQQIETVSLGEEKPRANDDDERAYAENRRADIVYAK